MNWDHPDEAIIVSLKFVQEIMQDWAEILPLYENDKIPFSLCSGAV